MLEVLNAHDSCLEGSKKHSRLAGSISQHLSFIYQFSTPPKKNVIGPYYIPQLTWFHYVILRRWTFWKIPNKKKKNTKMSQQKCPTPRISQLSENLQDFHPAIPFLHPPCYEELVKVDVPLSRSWPKMSAPRPLLFQLVAGWGGHVFRVFGVLLLNKRTAKIGV